MITFHLSAFLASLATGIALPLRLEVAASILFAIGFTLIALQDYARTPRVLPASIRPRAPRRPRAQFRPMPLSVSTPPQGIEIRPVIQRMREKHRLAA